MNNYDELLSAMPDALTPEFLDHLRNTKKDCVVKELEHWLVVENFKYHHQEGYQDHWTAFYKQPKRQAQDIASDAWKELFDWIPTYRQVLLNRESDRSITLFHLHIIK